MEVLNVNDMTKSKMNRAIIPAVLLMLIGFYSTPAAAETYQLKNGVEIKELFTIGVDDEDSDLDNPYLFTGVTDAVCDSTGNIYIFEFKTQRVRVFDKNGKFVKQLFSRGQGPKEINNAFGIGINQFNDDIYVLWQYGYSLTRYDKTGELIKKMMTPKQFYGQFEFFEENKYLFLGMNNELKPHFNKIKIVNIDTNKIASEFGRWPGNESHGGRMRFAKVGNTIWTAPGQRMVLLGYNLETGKKTSEITIPGSYDENIMKIKKTHSGGEMQRMIYFNMAQPFAVNHRLFVLVILQDYKKEGDSVENFPYQSKHVLYILDAGALKNIGELKNCDLMYLANVSGNRVLLKANDPYPRVKVLELSVQ